MDVGVIGAGRIGTLHLSFLSRHHGVDFIAVYDPCLDRQWSEQQGFIACPSEEALFARSLDAVVIASPSDQHLSHIQLAAQCNCAILCEKPIGLDLEGIQQTLAIVEKYHAFLHIGFNRRFDANFAALKQSIVASKATPQVLKITSRDPHCPPADYLKRSGGLMIDMAIHDFDMACFLAAAQPVSIQAMGSCTVDKGLAAFGDIDTAVTLIRFDNGAMAIIDNCRQAVYGYDQRVEVYTNQQQWIVDNPRQHAVESWHASGQQTAALPPFFLARYQQAYQQQMHIFLESVKQQKPPVVTGQDGFTAVKIALAATESLSSGKPVMIQ